MESFRLTKTRSTTIATPGPATLNDSDSGSVEITVAKGGSLLISEDGNGAIWRVRYAR